MQANDTVLSDPASKILGHYSEVVLEGNSTDIQLAPNAFDNVFRKKMCVSTDIG